MLPTLIQKYDKKKKKKKKKKKNISFWIQFKNERLTEILQTVRCQILWLY